MFRSKLKDVLKAFNKNRKGGNIVLGIIKFRNGLEKLTEIVASVFFVIGVVSTIYGTFARSFTFIPSIPWSSEVTRFSIIAAVLLVAGMGIRKGLQVSFTLILEKISPNLRLSLQMVNNSLMIIFFLFIGFYGFQFSISNSSFQSPILQLPMVYPYLFIPIGSLLVILEVIFLSIEQFIQFKDDKEN